MAEWSERLNRAMRRRRIKPPELARISGVSLENIYKYVKGTVDQPRGDTIRRLATALDVSPPWLRDKVGGMEDAAAAAFDAPSPEPLPELGPDDDEFAGEVLEALERLHREERQPLDMRELGTQQMIVLREICSENTTAKSRRAALKKQINQRRKAIREWRVRFLKRA